MSAPTISPIRFSIPSGLAEMTERLNKAFRQLELELRGIQNQIEVLRGVAEAVMEQRKAAAGLAVPQGPVPGGPSPLEPYLTPHSMLIGEGSTPVKQITGTDGQVPIACSNADPAFANITGDGTALSGILGVAIVNGCNSIEVTLNDSVQAWIITVSTKLSISPPT